jgi:nicotinamidase/pyrazinamidase
MISLQRGDALLIADIQNDFLLGGALSVPGGDEIVPVVSRYVDRFRSLGLPIFASKDWHPPNHCSFHERGGMWPAHCVAGSRGAEFPAGFVLPPETVFVYKAAEPDQEAYSAFNGTPLRSLLRAVAVRRLFVGGLATEYCVLNTVKDARQLGYDVCVLGDAVRAVNLRPDDGARAMEEMLRLGAVAIRWEEVAACPSPARC